MSDKIELNRRRVLGGLVTIGAAGAAVGAGTFAAFSDSESSDNNEVTAGTLNLELNPDNTNASTTISMGEESPVVPGDSGYIALGMENTGSLSGEIMSVNIGDADGNGNFTRSLITDSDGTAGEFPDPDPDSGELDEELEIEVFIEANGDFGGNVGTTQDSTVTPSGNENTVITDNTTLSRAVGEFSPEDTVSLSGSTNKVLVFNWSIPSGTGNKIQGDSVEFDLQVTLESA